MSININNIRLIQRGEPHHQEVYNRPVRDLISEADVSFDNLQSDVNDAFDSASNDIADAFDSASDDLSDINVPVGKVILKSTENPGEKYLPLDGSVYQKSTYSDLVDAVPKFNDKDFTAASASIVSGTPTITNIPSSFDVSPNNNFFVFGFGSTDPKVILYNNNGGVWEEEFIYAVLMDQIVNTYSVRYSYDNRFIAISNQGGDIPLILVDRENSHISGGFAAPGGSISGLNLSVDALNLYDSYAVQKVTFRADFSPQNNAYAVLIANTAATANITECALIIKKYDLNTANITEDILNTTTLSSMGIERPNYIRFSPDGTKLAIIHNNRSSISLINMDDYSVAVHLTIPETLLNSVRFSNDGKYLYYVRGNLFQNPLYSLYVFDIEANIRVFRAPRDIGNGFADLEVSSDNQYIFISSTYTDTYRVLKATNSNYTNFVDMGASFTNGIGGTPQIVIPSSDGNRLYRIPGVAPNFQEIQSANLNTFKLPFKASPIPGFKYYKYYIKAE